MLALERSLTCPTQHPEVSNNCALHLKKSNTFVNLNDAFLNHKPCYPEKAEYEAYFTVSDKDICQVFDIEEQCARTKQIAKTVGILTTDTKQESLESPITPISGPSKNGSSSLSLSISEDVRLKLSQYEIKEEEFIEIQKWYQTKKQSLKIACKNEHFKAAQTGLPRTVIYIAEGRHKGLHIKTKMSAGIGRFNRATKAYHIDTGLPTMARSGKAEDVCKEEREMNEIYASIDPEGKHFATGSPVLHKGNWRSREKMSEAIEDRYNPKEVPQEKDVDKVTLIMDDIPGGELFDLIVGRPRLPLFKKLTILSKLTDSIILAHANKLVNIDLKPENIFMLDETTPLIGDFGMAFNEDASLPKSMGSRGYLAPEILNFVPDKTTINSGTEIWTLGIIMSIFIKGTGFYNWTGQLKKETLHKICDSKILEGGIVEHFGEHPEIGSIEWCITRCLEYDPNERITAEQLQYFLKKLLKKHAPKQKKSLTIKEKK